MPPTAPSAIVPDYSLSTPTAPAAVVAAGSVSTPTAPSAVVAGFSPSSPTAPSAVVSAQGPASTYLVTGSSNANSNLFFTHVKSPSDQGLYSVTITDPLTAAQALSVGLSGQDITITLATGAITAATATVAFSAQPANGDTIFLAGEISYGRGFYTGFAGPIGWAKVQSTLTGTLDRFVTVFNADNYGTATVARSGNSLVFTAVPSGVDGNTKTISVTGSVMTASGATFSGGASVTSTASQVLAALNAAGAITAVVTVGLAAGTDGSGVMLPVAKAYLINGLSAAPPPPEAILNPHTSYPAPTAPTAVVSAYTPSTPTAPTGIV